MALEEYKTDIYRCYKCGGCLIGSHALPICPSGERFGFLSYYARGRMDVAYGLTNSQLDLSEKLLHIIYSCADCKACEDACTEQTSVRNLDIIMEMKREAVEKGFLPPEIRDFLRNIDRYGNPYKEPPEERGKWAQGMDIKLYSKEDYLFYVGCVGSYDDRGKKISNAFAKVLQKAGVQFGILGKRERSDGNEVNRVGDKWLFENIAAKNIELLKKASVIRITTISPHAFNALKVEYPKLGGDFEVSHSTQIMNQLIKEGKIKFRKEVNAKVVYHDPCWLGRRNGEYEAPRQILESVPNVQLLEMPRNREYSFCCGGGGGNFISDILGGGEKTPARIRVREAMETGANILAVACPICARMFEDAVKAENLDDALSIRDISEIVADSMAS